VTGTQTVSLWRSVVVLNHWPCKAARPQTRWFVQDFFFNSSSFVVPLCSIPCLSCFVYFFASFFLSLPPSITVFFFTVYFYRPLSVLPLCFLFDLSPSFYWYYSCFILNTGSAFNFLHQERQDVAWSADRADRCVLCSGALPVLVESWYWFLVLQNIIGTWDVHYRCADCNRTACLRACLSVRLSVC
jgi:hypothetical protein